MPGDSTSHSLTSPDFPSSYPPNQNRTWQLEAAKDSMSLVKIIFFFFDLEGPNSRQACVYDYLTVTESDSGATVMAPSCGSGLPPVLKTGSPRVTVTFR